MLEKTYQPGEIEDRLYRAWEDARAFEAGRPDRKGAAAYSIVIPPPNVTGSLHMGHALNNTLQDVLCRFERMRGKDVLWQPGTDHAGIATQMVVERQLMERQEPGRRDMGREAFVKRVWQWKEESGGTIQRQLKRLGASLDWRRERFTMDEGLSRAVIKVFVALYKEGLIYRDKRLVNWDPKLLTAISDLEVQQTEHRGRFSWSRNGGQPLNLLELGKVLQRDPNGHLYYLCYPIEGAQFVRDDPSSYILVATTRPETMLGDVAVAVHPENERLRGHIGKKAILPLTGRTIPILGDDYADPEKGTGAVKITPGHDFNDFEVWMRHKDRELASVIPICIFTPDARLKASTTDDFTFGHRGTDPRFPDIESMDDDVIVGEETFELIPKTLRGLDRFVARRSIIEMIDAQGLLEKIEPHAHMVPHGDRSGAVIEPFLTDQWYVAAKELAKDALAAVKEGRTVFVPKNWEKTYFDWLENIQPWCISRQLWWGHQIPAWYGPDGHVFVEETGDAAYEAARLHYISNGLISDSAYNELAKQPVFSNWLKRDEDVLDTWFSSALWPFSTLGWPDNTPELKRFYPTSALVTGFDIIFFWVARMMMMGLHFQEEVPFRDVYIHALVRDEKGAKMSKSKGNVIDPLSIIDNYGADALRFTLAAMAAQGRDIKLSTQRIEGYRNFATKLWNAARFAEINNCVRVEQYSATSPKEEQLNRWILGKVSETISEVTAALEAYRFNDAAEAIYQFTWNYYCDWYLEFAKPLLTGRDRAVRDETRATVAFVLDQILIVLHPFMPFITEELWRVTGQQGPARQSMLALASWPQITILKDGKAESEIGLRIDLISEVRSVRAELNIPSEARVDLRIVRTKELRELTVAWREAIMRLARVSDVKVVSSPPKGAIEVAVRRSLVALKIKGHIDVAGERARKEEEIEKVDQEIEQIDRKLANKDFVERAPAEVVEEQQERREDALNRRRKTEGTLKRLSVLMRALAASAVNKSRKVAGLRAPRALARPASKGPTKAKKRKTKRAAKRVQKRRSKRSKRAA